MPDDTSQTYSHLRGRVSSLVVRKRHLGLAKQDVLFASYPKSGSTWLRFILTHALTGEAIDFDLVPSLSPPARDPGGRSGRSFPAADGW